MKFCHIILKGHDKKSYKSSGVNEAIKLILTKITVRFDHHNSRWYHDPCDPMWAQIEQMSPFYY